MLNQLIPLLFIFQLTLSQGIDNLSINCVQGCKNEHIVVNGSLFWKNETLVDESKEFLQLELSNVKPEVPMSLQFELTELNKNNQSLYDIEPKQINKITKEKININIIFKCNEEMDLLFNLKVETNNTYNQSLIIPFSKKCTNKYFDPTQYSVYLKDLKNENISLEWNNNKPKLLEKNSAIFEFIPPINQTIYIQGIELSIDNNNTKSGKELIKNSSVNDYLKFVSNNKKLIIQPKITCNNISNEKILFNLKITSLKMEDPYFIYFYKQCDKKDQNLENNQEFPMFIGTKKNTNELFRAGVSQTDYNYTTKSISENNHAFQLFIYLKTKDTEKIQERFFSNGSKIEIEIVHNIADKEILKLKHPEKLTMNDVNDRKQILIQLDCQKQGNSTVYIDINFYYLEDSHKQASFSFNKFCPKTAQIQEKTLFGEIVYYIICIIAMLFGVQTIRLFTNLIKQDSNVQEVTIDTSYKRSYNQVEEENQIEL